MGGHGALAYAARHPDLIGAVAAADAASTGPGPDTVPFPVRGNSSRFHRTDVRISPSATP